MHRTPYRYSTRVRSARSNTLKDDRARLATTDARRADSVPLVEAVQGVHEVAGDSGAGRRERVAESCAERNARSAETVNHACECLIHSPIAPPLMLDFSIGRPSSFWTASH